VLSRTFSHARNASAKPHLFSFQACNPVSFSPENSLKQEADAGRFLAPLASKGLTEKSQAPGFSKTASSTGKKNAKFSGMLRKYHILQLHNQNPQSRPQAERGDSLAAFAEVTLLGPQDCGSPYSHKVPQPQRIYIF